MLVAIKNIFKKKWIISREVLIYNQLLFLDFGLFLGQRYVRSVYLNIFFVVVC